jgi:acyl-CoA thioesterase-2
VTPDTPPRGALPIAGTTPGDVAVDDSRLLGRAIMAAARQSPGHRLVSANLVFFGPPAAGTPLDLRLSDCPAGRTLTAMEVEAVQDGEPRAAGMLLLRANRAGHRSAPPGPDPGPDPGPGDPGGQEDDPGRYLNRLEVRAIDNPLRDSATAPGPVDSWVRFRPVPADPALHAGVLAQYAGQLATAAALGPATGRGPLPAPGTLTPGINAISLSLYADLRIDRWLHLRQTSFPDGGGLTQSECRVHTLSGRLVASFSVETTARGRSEPTAASA